jgi:hypothetical protein
MRVGERSEQEGTPSSIYIWVTSRQLLKVKILKLLKMGFPGSKSAPKYNPRVLEQNIQSFKSDNQLKIRKF